MIRVLTPGFLTTVQDLGRFGFSHLGITPSGAADALSLRVANRLVGNPDNTPALEMTLVGPSLLFERDCTVALAGATAVGGPPMLERVVVPAGTTLNLGALTSGARTYLAVHRGICVPSILGSGSTHLPGKFGGYEGRALKKGDVLKTAEAAVLPPMKPGAELADLFRRDESIRVTASAQWEWFDDNARDLFLSSNYIVTEQSNRSGLRLSGAIIPTANHSELLTEGVSLGAIQVPKDGQPIILFVDQQTTGGYPKIVNVISASMHHVGQLRPRDVIRFRLTTMDEALFALREQERLLNEALPR